MDGASVGLWDGSTVDGLALVGSRDILGRADGLNCVDGFAEEVGISVGTALLGPAEDGPDVGTLLGLPEGVPEGNLLGDVVGTVDGFPDGL